MLKNALNNAFILCTYEGFHHIFTFIKKQSILTPDNNFIRAIEKVE